MLSDQIADGALPLAVLVAALAGLVSFATPCARSSRTARSPVVVSTTVLPSTSATSRRSGFFGSAWRSHAIPSISIVSDVGTWSTRRLTQVGSTSSACCRPANTVSVTTQPTSHVETPSSFCRRA